MPSLKLAVDDVIHAEVASAAVCCFNAGNISYADIMETLPFSITVDVVELAGKDLYSIFEFSVDGYSPCVKHGKFLQMSGASSHVTTVYERL